MIGKKYLECVECGMIVIDTWEELEIHQKEIDHEKITHDINGYPIDDSEPVRSWCNQK